MAVTILCQSSLSSSQELPCWPRTLDFPAGEALPIKPYTYRTVEPAGDRNGKDEIRLIRLHHGYHGSPISVSLVNRCLEDRSLFGFKESEQQKYEALSYVWGDASVKKRIYVFENEPLIIPDIRAAKEFLMINPNLEIALQQIRDTEEDRFLWIDAVCIDQQNVQERNSQVTLMNQIYTKATKVIVWLGVGSDKVNEAISFLELMKRDGQLANCEDSPYGVSICERRLCSLDSILSQSWWERTWTLQEILLARDAEILCGQFRIAWGDLTQALANIERQFDGLNCCVKCSSQYYRFREHVGGLHQQRLGLKDNQGLDLLGLLSQYRYRKVSVAKDKVYALLGVALEEQSAKFEPDYSCKDDDLWIKTAVCNISFGSLRSLNYAADTESSPELPSWATDWNYYSQGIGIKTALQTRYEMYDAAKDVVWSGTFTGMEKEPYSNCIFSTDGVLFDKVQAIGDPSVFEHLEDSYPALKQWQALLKDHFKIQDLSARYIGGGTIENAFWRALTGDVVVPATRGHEVWYQRASSAHQRDFRAWWDAIQEDKPMEFTQRSSMNAFLTNMNTAICRRRIFVTEKGYIGNGPAKVRCGDEVFILCGGKMPLVLRRDHEPTTNPQKSREDNSALSSQPKASSSEPTVFHTFIGDCYIHGIMDGEAASNFHERSRRIHLK